MMNCTYIDFENREIKTTVKSNGIVINMSGDNDTIRQVINLTYDEFDNIVDEVRKQTNEKTVNELEEIIVDLLIENERLKDLVEQFEEYQDHIKEKNEELF